MNALNRPEEDGLPLGAPLQGIEVSVVMVVYRTGPALGESLRRVLAGSEVDWMQRSDEEIIAATMGELQRLFPEQASSPRHLCRQF